MRPSLLDPLFAPITSLAGVGPKVATLIERVLPVDPGDREARAADLLFVLPNSVIDRRSRPGIANAVPGAIVTLDLTIDRHQPPPRGNRSVPYRIFAHDDTDEITLTFFHAHAAYLEKQLPEGAQVVVSGRMEWYNGRPSMVHPDHIALAEEAANLPLVEPVYPLTAGLSGKVLRRAVAQALSRVPELPEWQDAASCAATPCPPSAWHWCASTTPKRRQMRHPTARHGAGSPMTSSLRDRFRWRWCGPACGGCPAGR
jgi:ATP-dependent DNA helicase RecG